MTRAAKFLGVGLVVLLAACATGKKKPPMTPETTDTSTDESAWSTADGGSVWSSSTNEGDAGAAPKAEEPPAAQGSEDGARALLTQFTREGADHAALTKSLRPTSADYKAIFDGASATKVEGMATREWDKGKFVIAPKAKQTELKIWSATTTDLATGKGNAKEFPGGYKKLAKRLAPGVIFYRFKFVEPGKNNGSSFDGLAFVNGHWVVVPKAWRAFEKG